MISVSVCMLTLFVAMGSCFLAICMLEAEIHGVGLTAALMTLFGCAGCGIAGLQASAGNVDRVLRDSVREAHPELQRYGNEGFVTRIDDWRDRTKFCCTFCFVLVSAFCTGAIMSAFLSTGDGRLAAIFFGPVAVLMCSGGVYGWRETVRQSWSWPERALLILCYALIFPIMWPVALELCGLRCFADLVLKPPKRSLDAAVHTTREHTIVFEGNVLAECETVCSWPGKYAAAWDELVAGSRQDDISAAVVFLPKGSMHYGFHDPIPARPQLQDLQGECWCIPLYGERKTWGCRWWSKWISNIEEAVSKKCTLVVYYFNGMRLRGTWKFF